MLPEIIILALRKGMGIDIVIVLHNTITDRNIAFCIIYTLYMPVQIL